MPRKKQADGWDTDIRQAIAEWNTNGTVLVGGYRLFAKLYSAVLRGDAADAARLGYLLGEETGLMRKGKLHYRLQGKLLLSQRNRTAPNRNASMREDVRRLDIALYDGVGGEPPTKKRAARLAKIASRLNLKPSSVSRYLLTHVEHQARRKVAHP